MLRRQCNKLAAGLEQERVLPDEEYADAVLRDRGEGGFKIALARGRDHEQFLSNRLRGALQLMQFFQRIRAVWMSEQRNHADIRNKLARKLEPLRTQARTDDGDARDVASRLVEARDEAGLDWIEGCDKDNGN
jgi:hypothetical protein